MSLRNVTLLLTGATAAVCIALVSLVSEQIIMSGYADLERTQVRESLRRAQAALDAESGRIMAILKDWAYWDDTLDFVAGTNDGFADANLMDTTFRSLQIDVMLFFSPDGALVRAKRYDPGKNAEVPLSAELLDIFVRDSPWVRFASEQGHRSGLALAGEDALMLGALPILDSNAEGPAGGAMVMGRFLGRALVEELAGRTLLDLGLLPARAGSLDAEHAEILGLLSAGQDMVVKSGDGDRVSGFALLRDTEGRPVFLLRVSQDRDIMRQGRDTLRYTVVAVAATVLLIGLALFALMDRRVVSRVASLSREVDGIAGGEGLSRRVEASGRDELARLGGAINAMLADLERSAAALRESEAQHRAMFEDHRAVMLLLDPESGLVADANPAAAEFYGYSREDLKGMPLLNICLLSRQELAEKMGKAQAAGPARFECRQRLATGEVREVMVQTGLVEGGGLRLVHAIVFDATERRWAENALQMAYAQMEARVQARTEELNSSNALLRAEIAEREQAEAGLRESRERLARITGSAYDAILMLDSRGLVSYANPAAERLFGRAAGELAGGDAARLFTCTVMPGFPRDVGEDQSGITAECELHAGEGREVPVELSLSTVAGREGRETVLVVRDVSVRRAAEEALQRAKEEAEEVSRLKSEFITMLSHEMRTPMTSILGFAKIILKRLERDVLPGLAEAGGRAASSGALAVRNLEIIVAEGERLTDMMSDVLDLAKLEAGRAEWRPRRVDLAGLLREAREKTASLFEAQGLAWGEDLEGGLPLVLCDPDKVLQVLMNLISNAVKFTPAGTVRIRLRRDGDCAVVAVEDSGIGISTQDQAKLFGKFVQLSDTLTDKPRGTGLGLSICKHIVELHSGRIWVESEPGRGSTFSFTLPLAPEAEDAGGEEREA
ncbi:MAG: ATP-binding protein [Thermodesulfobacteriota bacterium]